MEQGTMNKEQISVFWFRRDLRLEDNRGLSEALKAGLPVVPFFIFDVHILDKLPSEDRRVAFIHQELGALDKELRKMGSGLLVKRGDPVEVFSQLLEDYNVFAVYTNTDFEPYAIERDRKVKELLSERNISFYPFTDHVIMEPGTVVRPNGQPYEVFTPFRNQWINIWRRDRSQLVSEPSGTSERQRPVSDRFFQYNPPPIPSLREIGFNESDIAFPSKEIEIEKIVAYDQTRDIPALDSTTRLGMHLRFGTISIRKLAEKAFALSETFLNELIWREFFIHILAQHPEVVQHSFKARYDNIRWLNDENTFRRWQEGTTGYPLVDAGMRELKATGFMHNRVRMVTAGFLVKHLLIDWRWGEAWFASLLLDYELASNNGNWQWAAGCGCDAAPYFRIFNPIRQQQRFDPDFKYIRKWLPEYGTAEYPAPIVDHEFARQRCINTYKEALKQ